MISYLLSACALCDSVFHKDFFRNLGAYRIHPKSSRRRPVAKVRYPRLSPKIIPKEYDKSQLSVSLPTNNPSRTGQDAK